MPNPVMFSSLPDLDDAPDVYETHDTIETSTARSPSLTSSRSSLSDDNHESSGIHRSPINHKTAERVFHTARIGASDVDFSDRLVGVGRRRKSYHVKSAGRGVHDSEEENDIKESPKEKLARLMREVEELKTELDEKDDEVKADEKHAKSASRDEDLKMITELTRVLRDLQHQKPAAHDTSRTTTASNVTLTEDVTERAPRVAGPLTTYESTTGIEAHTSQVLIQATALEARLAALETLIGSPQRQHGVLHNSKPVLDHLTILEDQLFSISKISPSSLESVSSKIEQLLDQTSSLNAARSEATSTLQKLQAQRSMGVPKNYDPASIASNTLANNRGTGSTTLPPHAQPITAPPQLLEDPQHLARVQKLYDALPAVESTLPVVPAIVERLRTLKTVHSDAASARQDLKELERRQGEMGTELSKWREGLMKLEMAIGDARQGDEENRTEMQMWVKELEERLTRLG